MISRNATLVLLCAVLLATLPVGCKKDKSDYLILPGGGSTDKTPPVTMTNPPGGTYAATVNVTLATNEPGTVYYATDGSTPTISSYTGKGVSPISGLPISSNTLLKFFAVDKAGNEESVKTQNYVLGGADVTPPTTTANPPGGSYNHAVSVALNTDEPATVYYTTDGSTPTTGSQAYSSPISITADTTLKFFGVDTASNQESVKAETYDIDLTGDTTPPVTTASPSGGTYGSAVSVTLTSNEPATVYYTTDGREPTESDNDGTGASPLSGINITVDTTLKFFGKDAADNVEGVKTEAYVIGGGTAPVITGITPDTGQFGTEVTITGTDFGSSGTVTFFNGKVASTSSWSDTSITCTVPALAESGDVTVTTTGGTSNGMHFNVIFDPGSHGTGGEMGASTRNYWGYKWKSNYGTGSYDYYIGVHQHYADHPEEPAPLMVFANTHETGWLGAHLVAAAIGNQALSSTELEFYPENYNHPGMVLYWSTGTEHYDEQWGEILGLVEEMKGLYNIDTTRVYWHSTCNKSGYFIGLAVYQVDVYYGASTDSSYPTHGDLDSWGNSPETWPAENKRMPCIFETNWSYGGGVAWRDRLCANGWVRWYGTSEQGVSKKQWQGWITEDPHHDEGDVYTFPVGWEKNQHYGVWEWHLHHRNPNPGVLTKP